MTVIGQRQRSPFGMTVIGLSFRKENQICYGFAADLSAHLSFRNEREASHFGMKIDDSHIRKKIRFLLDLFLIYPSFRNDERLSFRND